MAESFTYVTPLIPGLTGFVHRDDGAFIPCDLENMDYQAFLAWMTAGNPAPEGWPGPTNATPTTG